MRLCAILVLILGFQEPADYARLISDLRHEEIARREEALKGLLEAGAKALPALEAALKATAELPRRTELEEIIRRIREKEHETAERRRKLELLSFDSPESTLHDVIAAVEKGSRFKVWTGVDRDQKVRLKGRDQPLRKVMDAIEDQLGLWIHEKEDRFGEPRWILDIFRADKPPRPPRIVIAGAMFKFAKFPFEEEGKFVGWIVETESLPSADLHLTSLEAERSDGSALPVEARGESGLERVLIRMERPEAIRLRLKGFQVWDCSTVFSVEKPEAPVSFRSGLFSVYCEYPKVRITCPTPVEPLLFARTDLPQKLIMLLQDDFDTKLDEEVLITERTYEVEQSKPLQLPWRVEVIRPVQEFFDERVTIPAD